MHMVHGARKFQKNKFIHPESQCHLHAMGNIGKREYMILHYPELLSNSCGGNTPFHKNIYVGKIVETGVKSVSTKYADF